MDGAFVAYHNTKETFGFDYVKTKEIERRIFGSEKYSDICFMVCSKILIATLDNILDHIKYEDYEMVKVGFYACSTLKKLVIFAELFDSNVEWGKEYLVDQTPEMRDEFDYYNKFKKEKTKVYKFETVLYPFINGVHQRSSNFDIHTNDQIEVKYKFKYCGRANFVDYMNFLHEAYKLE